MFYNTKSTATEKAAFRNELKTLIQNNGAVYIHAAAPQGSYFNSSYKFFLNGGQQLLICWWAIGKK